MTITRVSASLNLTIALLLTVSCGRMSAFKTSVESIAGLDVFQPPPVKTPDDEEPISVALVTPYQSLVPENEIWVAPYGDDANAGNIYEPKETIMAALAVAMPGTAIMVKAGKYEEVIDFTGKTGASNRPIWIRSADGKGAAEVSPLEVISAGIVIKGARSVVIEGMKIKGGIHIQEDILGNTSAMIILKNNLIWQCFTSGIQARNTDYLFAVSNDISNCSMGEGIDLNGTIMSAIVDNFVHDLHNSSTLNDGMRIRDALNVHIANNIVEHVDGYGILLEGANHKVEANSFSGAKGAARISNCMSCSIDQSY